MEAVLRNVTIYQLIAELIMAIVRNKDFFQLALDNIAIDRNSLGRHEVRHCVVCGSPRLPNNRDLKYTPFCNGPVMSSLPE
jgi:hypothetical protein